MADPDGMQGKASLICAACTLLAWVSDGALSYVVMVSDSLLANSFAWSVILSSSATQ